MASSPQIERAPPGSVEMVAPELDVFIEETIIPQYTQGKKRKRNPEYRHLEWKIREAQARHDWRAVERYQQGRRSLPSLDIHDLDYRWLFFVRYADDVRHLTRS